MNILWFKKSLAKLSPFQRLVALSLLQGCSPK